MNIKVGRKYRTRNGLMVAIDGVNEQASFPFTGMMENNRHRWTADGRWTGCHAKDEWDLVEDLGPILTLKPMWKYKTVSGDLVKTFRESVGEPGKMIGEMRGQTLAWNMDGSSKDSDLRIMEEVGPMLEIKPGHKYKTRDGKVVSIVQDCGDGDSYPMKGVVDGDVDYWTRGGRYDKAIEKDDLDLVEQIGQSLTLSVGKRYRMRNGEVAKVTSESDHSFHGIYNRSYIQWNKEGRYGPPGIQSPLDIIEEVMSPTATFVYEPGTILRLKSGEKFKVYEKGFNGLINGAIWVRVPPGGWNVFAVDESDISGPWKEEPPAPWKPITEPLAGEVLALTVHGTVIIGFAIRMIGDKWVANDRPGNEYTVTHYTEIPPTE